MYLVTDCHAPVQAPLEDPGYVPEHPPVDGTVPDIVAKWGPQSQLRWFTRFHGQVKPMRHEEWGQFYCESDAHRGLCCGSCVADQKEGYYDMPERCCCKAIPGP